MGPSSTNSDPNDLGPCYEALEFSSWFRHPIPYSRGLLVLLPLFACLEGCLKMGTRPLAGDSPEHSILASVTPPIWYRKAYS